MNATAWRQRCEKEFGKYTLALIIAQDRWSFFTVTRQSVQPTHDKIYEIELFIIQIVFCLHSTQFNIQIIAIRL